MFGFRNRFNGSDDSGEGKGRINRKRVRIEKEVRNSFMRPATEAFPYFYIQCHQPSSGFYNRRLSRMPLTKCVGLLDGSMSGERNGKQRRGWRMHVEQ